MKSGILHITALYYVYKRQYTTELASSAALQFFLFTKKKKRLDGNSNSLKAVRGNEFLSQSYG